jgi:hypothetical protein
MKKLADFALDRVGGTTVRFIINEVVKLLFER